MMPARSVAPDPAAVWPRQVTPAVVWHARLIGGLQRLRQTGDEVIRYALIVMEELQDRRGHCAEQRCRSDRDGRQAWASGGGRTLDHSVADFAGSSSSGGDMLAADNRLSLIEVVYW